MDRVDRPERLDSGEAPLDEVRLTLSELDRINRWLGGYAALRRFVFPRMKEAAKGKPLRVLDVACGGAGVAIEIVKWARAHDVAVQVTALDLIRRHLEAAAETAKDYPEIRLLQADARRPPVVPGAFDFVASTLFLHHLSPSEATEAMRAWRDVCRGTLMVNDLTRSRVALLFFRTAAPLFARSEITVQDGLVSIERAYRPEELRAMVRAAGLRQAKVYTHGLYYRMTAVSDGLQSRE